MELGEFAYKSNKYWYIERYMIAFKDEWGYTELIVHAPPLNMAQVLLLPSVFKQDQMLRAAKAFSMAIFWFESLIYIIFHLIYELSLVPFIYIKQSINIIKLAGVRGIHLLLAWLLVGFWYLLSCAAEDMFYYVKILCDYKQDDDLQNKMKTEDYQQDKKVIYEEIINVIKSIYFIFLQKQNKKLNRSNRIMTDLRGDMPLQEALQKQINLEME